jgi:hypothetical protein
VRNEKDLYDRVDRPLQSVAANEHHEGTRKWLKKTILEKAAEKVGYGLAMAEDVAGSVKTAFGRAVATVTEALTPAKKASEPLAKKAPVKSAPKKAPAKKIAAKKSPTKKITTKKAAKKFVKTSAKKAGHTKR